MNTSANNSNDKAVAFSKVDAPKLSTEFKTELWQCFRVNQKGGAGDDKAAQRAVQNMSNRASHVHLHEILQGQVSILGCFGIPGFGTHVAPSDYHSGQMRSQMSTRLRSLRAALKPGKSAETRTNAINAYRGLYVEWIIVQVNNWFKMRKTSYDFVKWFLEKAGKSAMVNTAETAAAAAADTFSLPGSIDFDVLQLFVHLGVSREDFLHLIAHSAWGENFESKMFPGVLKADEVVMRSLIHQLFGGDVGASPARSRAPSSVDTNSSGGGRASMR